MIQPLALTTSNESELHWLYILPSYMTLIEQHGRTSCGCGEPTHHPLCFSLCRQAQATTQETKLNLESGQERRGVVPQKNEENITECCLLVDILTPITNRMNTQCVMIHNTIISVGWGLVWDSKI